MYNSQVMNKLKLILSSFIFIFTLSAQKSVVVTNTSGRDRNGELVEVKANAEKNSFLTSSFVLKNQKGKEIGYQLIYNDKKEVCGFLFQANVKARSTVTYSISKGTPAVVKAKTFGRYVPERKDDFAWENDFAAYRMYGPALAAENPSNGVDYWAKKTDELIVDEFYNGELKNGLSYHRDRGHGLDFYKVAHTLGCGGVALYANNKLWVGNHYDTYQVLENGPLRTVFQLIYNSVNVGEDTYKATVTITAEAGSLLNKAVVSYEGKDQPLQIATGIYIHDGKGILISNYADGLLAYAEDAVSEFKEPSGRNYVGVVIPGKNFTAKNEDNHALLLSNYQQGKHFTYYFGGGWNQWKFPTDADWFKAVENFKYRVSQPLSVKLK